MREPYSINIEAVQKALSCHKSDGKSVDLRIGSGTMTPQLGVGLSSSIHVVSHSDTSTKAKSPPTAVERGPPS